MTVKIAPRSEQRYASLAVSSDWKLDRLRTARALVVGAGALGNEVCKNLGMLGVRHITIIDMDHVEVGNLTRSVFFREADRGQPKAEILAARVRDLNPDVAVWPIVRPVVEAIGLGVVRRSDMVFSCLDNRQARLDVNRMCHKVGRAWVDGSMEDLDGEVAVYAPGAGPCYECTMTQTDWKIVGQRLPCNHVARQQGAAGRVPTTSTMGSIIAALQVQEAIKLHQGDERGSLVGRRFVVNGRINDFYAVTFDPRPGCLGHEMYGEVVEQPRWKSNTTTVREVLDQFEADTGEEGRLDLGIDLVTGLDCFRCDSKPRWAEVCRSPIRPSQALCPECQEEGAVIATDAITRDYLWVDYPLARLTIPALEVLKVTSATETRWYELTGDLADLPTTIR